MLAPYLAPLALLVGYWLASTARGRAVLLVCGTVAVVALHLVFVATTDPSTCHDCTEALGGAYDAFTLPLAALDVLVWVAGVASGGWLRRRRRARSAG